MQKLVLIRHGNYRDTGNGGELDDQGKRQMRILAAELGKRFKKMSVTILSSAAGRALESAHIVADEFGLSFEQHEILWSDEAHYQKNEGVLELIKQNLGSEVVVLVTHLEYIEFFPGYFFVNFLDRKCTAPNGDSKKGAAYIINCSSHEIERVGPFDC